MATVTVVPIAPGPTTATPVLIFVFIETDSFDCGAALLLTLRHVPAAQANAKHGLDAQSQLMAIVAVGPLTLTLTQAGRLGWFLPRILGILFSLVAVVTFCWLELYAVSVQHRPTDKLRAIPEKSERTLNSATQPRAAQTKRARLMKAAT